MSPTRPLRACRTPRCPGLVERGYCETCRARLGLTDRQARTGSHWSDWNRGTSTQRGYGVEWRRLREQVLTAEPLCRPCQQQHRVSIAKEVHHIIAKADGGTDALSNLEPRCVSCHRTATAAMRQPRESGGVEKLMVNRAETAPEASVGLDAQRNAKGAR
jgi:5-methylcytosine-specific restriction protein A